MFTNKNELAFKKNLDFDQILIFDDFNAIFAT